jgi:predicted nucleic acid-binding protein
LARIFWDTNLFIYLFEKNPIHAGRVQELRRSMLARGDSLVTSAVTVGELLVKPLELDRRDVADRYLGFFNRSGIHVQPFDLKAAALYGSIRRDRAIPRPDAMQLACAAAAEVDLFVTNDERLSRKTVAGITFICALARAPI